MRQINDIKYNDNEQDYRNPAEGIYYVRDGNYPYAFYRIDFVWESTQEIFEKQHKELIQ